VLRLILVALKVEIVGNGVVSTFVGSGHDDLHIELTPSFLFDAEWRLLYHYLLSINLVYV